MSPNGTSPNDEAATSEIPLWNLDSAAFFNTLVNSAIGIGKSEYDTAFFDEISETRYLTDSEILNLYDSSRIAKTIVDLYPNECNFGVLGLPSNSNLDTEKINDYLSQKLDRTIESYFREASQQARKWSVCYLVLGFDDGQGLDQPLAENKLKSLEWIEILSKDQLFAEGFPSFYDSEYYYFYSDTRYFSQYNLVAEKLKGRIHKSRIIRFLGETTDQKSQLLKPRFNSALQVSIAPLLNKDKSMALANQLLLKKAVLYAQLKVAGAGANIEANREKLQERLSYVNLLQSIYRMVGLGTDESLSALQIDLGSVDTILKANLSELVASSGITRQKLLGESAQEGLGQSSRGLESRLEHSQRCLNYSKQFWHDHLLRFYSLICKTQELVGSTPITGLSIYFPPNLELFPQEIAELRKLNSEWAQTLTNLGILTKPEIRETFTPSNLLEQLVPNIVMDQRYTEQLKEEILVTKKEPATLETDAVIQESNQDDASPTKRVIPWQGFKLGLQYLPFDRRFGKILPCAYGYIQNVKGVDKKSLDCYVVPQTDLDSIDDFFIIDQLSDSGQFDEHKAVIGVRSMGDAIDLFVSIRGIRYFGGIKQYKAKDIKSFEGYVNKENGDSLEEDSKAESNQQDKVELTEDGKITDDLSSSDQKVLDKALELISDSLDSDQIDSILAKI